MTEMEETVEPLISAFLLEGTPIIYYGELYYDSEDPEHNRLVFKKALVNVQNIEEKSSKWIRVPTAGRDSLVQIDTRTMRGILVKNIDQKEASAYKEASLKLYSSIHLAP